MAPADGVGDSDSDDVSTDGLDGSDAYLTDRLRAAPAAAYPALRTLRARHHPAVLAYARRCTTSEPAARRLAAEAFTLAARETARGNDPGGPWRHQLLLLSWQVAADWAADDRVAGWTRHCCSSSTRRPPAARCRRCSARSARCPPAHRESSGTASWNASPWSGRPRCSD